MSAAVSGSQWDCQSQGHLFTHGSDRCAMCGTGMTVRTSTPGFTSATSSNAGTGITFPDADKVLDQMQALQRAQELLDAGNGPPDAIRVLAEQRAREMGVDVKFMRSVGGDGELRWRVLVSTKRGDAQAVPGLTQKQMTEMALDSDEWRMQGWKNALKAVGLL